MSITSRMPRAEYDAIEALSITKLKGLRRSPQHYQHLLEHPKTTDALTLGTATHTAVLEPERFLTDFAIWDRTTESGRRAPRNGKWWDAFQLEHKGQTILTDDEARIAQAIAAAVRFDANANKYLASGDPEATLQWEIVGRPAKGRVDWFTSIDGHPWLVGLKTSRDCRHFAFGAQAARLGYHLQFAFYADGYHAITGKNPNMIEIVVENTAPYAVAVYRITDDIMAQGRDEYMRLLDLLDKCESTGEWPGPVPTEEDLTLPSWAYASEDNDLAELGLEGA